MADQAALDQNSRSSLLGASSTDGVSTVKVYADPVTHRLLVDLAGGNFPSELGQEVPSGTVNGVNTVFTVQNVPVIMEVSGQIMASSTQNPSNYGYTLTGSSAPYTVTYVNAPTQAPDSWYNYNGTASGFVYNEIVSGSGTSFTLANLPIAGTQAIYGQGQRLYPGMTKDYTISGANITTTDSWLAGQILADYQDA